MDHSESQDIIFGLCESIVKCLMCRVEDNPKAYDLVYDLHKEIESNSLKTSTIKSVIKAINES